MQGNKLWGESDHADIKTVVIVCICILLFHICSLACWLGTVLVATTNVVLLLRL